MKKLENMIRPISESSIDLVRPDVDYIEETKDENNVDVEFCEDKLVIKYQEDVMIMTRDVLQNILLIVEAKDRIKKEAEILAKEQKEKAEMLEFIKTTTLHPVKSTLTVDDVLERLNDWDMMSEFHQYNIHSYVAVLFGSGLINLADYDIRKAVYERI